MEAWISAHQILITGIIQTIVGILAFCGVIYTIKHDSRKEKKLMIRRTMKYLLMLEVYAYDFIGETNFMMKIIDDYRKDRQGKTESEVEKLKSDLSHYSVHSQFFDSGDLMNPDFPYDHKIISNVLSFERSRSELSEELRVFCRPQKVLPLLASEQVGSGSGEIGEHLDKLYGALHDANEQAQTLRMSAGEVINKLYTRRKGVFKDADFDEILERAA